jgi:hypothetical protein
VQGVAQQGHRSGDGDHDGLRGGGGTQHGQGDPQRVDALAGGLHRRVDLAGGVVAVRAQQVPEPVPPRRPPATTITIGMAAIVMPVVLVVASGGHGAVPQVGGGGVP